MTPSDRSDIRPPKRLYVIRPLSREGAEAIAEALVGHFTFYDEDDRGVEWDEGPAKDIHDEIRSLLDATS